MSQIHELLTDQIGSPKCFCGNSEGFKLKQKPHNGGYHVGLYCLVCKAWIKWVSPYKIKKTAVVEEAAPKQEALW